MACVSAEIVSAWILQVPNNARLDAYFTLTLLTYRIDLLLVIGYRLSAIGYWLLAQSRAFVSIYCSRREDIAQGFVLNIKRVKL